MDLEETKKIIQKKIEADETAREVRSQISSYIHEKQNVREGFTSEAVKTSIDTQRNKLIKQLQDNQLALTEGLNKNRLAITSGFDKMDEVKKWDLSQLPGFEAIEEPDKETEEDDEEEGDEEYKYLISKNDLKLLFGGKESDFTQEDESLFYITRKQLDRVLSKNRLNEDKYELKLIDPGKKIYKVIKKNFGEKAQKEVVIFDDLDLDKGLLSAENVKILKELKLPLPSKIKNKKLEDIRIYQKHAEVHLG